MTKRYLTYIIFSFLVISLCGCSHRYIQSNVSSKDTIFKYVEKIDSVCNTDSVFVNQYVNGDTVYKERVRVVIRDRVRIKNDTLFKSRVDSVRVIVPVEKKLTKWQETKIKVGGFSISAILLVLVYLSLYAIFRRFKR